MGILPALPVPLPACASPSIHDGDTIRCGAVRIRSQNVDARELLGSPKCEDHRRRYAWCDFAKNYETRNGLRAFLERGPVRMTRQGVGQYGGTLAQTGSMVQMPASTLFTTARRAAGVEAKD